MELELKSFNDFITSQAVYKDVKGKFVQFLRYYLHTDIDTEITSDMLNNFIRKCARSIYDEQQKRFCTADDLQKAVSDTDTEYTFRCINNNHDIMIIIMKGTVPAYSVFSPVDGPDDFVKNIDKYLKVEESEESEESE